MRLLLALDARRGCCPSPAPTPRTSNAKRAGARKSFRGWSSVKRSTYRAPAAVRSSASSPRRAGVDRAVTTLLVLVHGIGVHPDHGIVGRLRMDLADKGFATLSIQMPVLASDAPPEHYEPLFGNAAERIANAAAWSRARGYRDLVLVSHSLGNRMSNAYFDRAAKPDFRAWVALGLGAPFSTRLAQQPRIPVLDVHGELDLDSVRETAPSRAKVAASSGGQQHRIAGADHFYSGHESELVALIVTFASRK